MHEIKASLNDLEKIRKKFEVLKKNEFKCDDCKIDLIKFEERLKALEDIADINDQIETDFIDVCDSCREPIYRHEDYENTSVDIRYSQYRCRICLNSENDIMK